MYIEVKGETLRIIVDALQAYKVQLIRSRDEFKTLSDREYRIKITKVTKLIIQLEDIKNGS